jgi:hypothetical protein
VVLRWSKNLWRFISVDLSTSLTFSESRNRFVPNIPLKMIYNQSQDIIWVLVIRSDIVWSRCLFLLTQLHVELLYLNMHRILEGEHKSYALYLSNIFRSPLLSRMPTCGLWSAVKIRYVLQLRKGRWKLLFCACRYCLQWPPGLRRGPWARFTLDRGFESRLGHGCMSLVYVVLSCVGTGLATGWSLVQEALPYVVKTGKVTVK